MSAGRYDTAAREGRNDVNTDLAGWFGRDGVPDRLKCLLEVIPKEAPVARATIQEAINAIAGLLADVERLAAEAEGYKNGQLQVQDLFDKLLSSNGALVKQHEAAQAKLSEMRARHDSEVRLAMEGMHELLGREGFTDEQRDKVCAFMGGLLPLWRELTDAEKAHAIDLLADTKE